MTNGEIGRIQNTLAGKVRALMGQQGLSSTALAKMSGLSPSWLSRLLTENNEARRKAGIDDILALARALGVTAAELASGTDAESELGRWVPRESFEQEVQARHAAQKEASDLRTQAAGLESQVALLGQELERMAETLVRKQDELTKTKRGQLSLQLQLVTAQASQRQAEVERDQACRQAQVNYDAYVAAKEASTSAAVLGGVVGFMGGAALAKADSTPRRRRRSSVS